MKVIAKKSFSVGVLYTVCLVFGVIFFLLGFVRANSFVVGVPLFFCSLAIIIDYCLIPAKVIMLNKQKELILPKNTRLPLQDIADVSYRRASARGIQYKWGTVKISSSRGFFKYRYISDCEAVAKEIMKLMYEVKSLSGKGDFLDFD